VLEGEPDHRDSILTADEKARCATMFVCVSGSKSARLVLDL
jgi:vanillate O-demethylase ferredoxin subunit